MPRPTELTPELTDRIAQFIRAGNWPERAAVAAGGSERSYYRWLARGQKAEEAHQAGQPVDESDEPYWQFWQEVKRAEAQSEALAVGYLVTAMPTAPTAVVSFLERRFRDRWSRSERLEHAGDGGGPVVVSDARAKLSAMLDAVAIRLAENGEDR
jgi:hypothetical protein